MKDYYAYREALRKELEGTECELHLVPRIERAWVHFDREWVKDGEVIGWQRCGTPYPEFPAFRKDEVASYIACADKKKYREEKETEGALFDGEFDLLHPGLKHDVNRCFFHGAIIMAVRVTCIRIVGKVYICPTLGDVWKDREDSTLNAPRSFWLRRLPFADAARRSYGGSRVYPSRVFLSGQMLVRRLGWDWPRPYSPPPADPRAFLLRDKRIDPRPILKAVRRNLVSRAVALTKKQVNFFRMLLGAGEFKKLQLCK